MDFLSNEQIIFEKVICITDPKSPFFLGFISNRLAKLIQKKTKQGKWKVLQIAIVQSFYFPGYLHYPYHKAVFTAPTKKTILAVSNILY